MQSPKVRHILPLLFGSGIFRRKKPPATQHILESYPLLTPAEKNRLWKLVMKKATVYRSPDDKLTVNIYPNLPK